MSVTSRARTTLLAVMGTAALGAAGIVVWAGGDTPMPAANLRSPCIGDACFVCLTPTVAECAKFMQNGGEPAFDMTPLGTSDPYSGAAGKLGRNMRQLLKRDAMKGWHASWVNVATGTCLVTVFASADQRRAWRQVVDTLDAANEVSDCRRAALPGAKRGVVLAGTAIEGVDGGQAAESEPTDDAGPDLDVDAGP